MSTNVTLSGNIQNIIGTADASQILISLNNLGNMLPYTSDGVLGNITQTVTCNGSGAYSVALYSQAQITPINTFYTITIKDSTGAFVSQADYVLSSGTYTLQSLTPIVAYPGTSVGVYAPLSSPQFSGTVVINNLTIDGSLRDSTGSLGSSNQVLTVSSSTGLPIWATGTGGGSVTIADLASVEGNGSKVQLTNAGTTTSGHVVTYDGSGNVQDSGTLLSSLAPLASPTFTGTLTGANVSVTGTLKDGTSSVGTNGYLLSSTGTGIKWISASGTGTVTSVATSGIATGGTITTAGTITVAGSGSSTTAATAATNLASATSGHILTADGSGNVQDSGTALSSITGSFVPTTYESVDDFSMTTASSSVTASTTFQADTTWGFNLVGTVTNAQGNGVSNGIANHLGEFNFGGNSGSTAGSGAVLYKGGSVGGSLNSLASYTFNSYFVLKLSGTSTIRLRAGFCKQGTEASVEPTDGIWVRYDTNASYADTKYNFVCRSSSTSTVTASTISPDTNYHTFRIWSTSAGTIQFSIDGGSPTSISTNVSTQNMNPFIQILTDNTSNTSCTIDYYSFNAAVTR